jgi:HSP20 family protein
MFFTMTQPDPGVLEVFRRLGQEMDALFDDSWSRGIRSTGRVPFPPLNVGVTPERVDVYLFAAGLDPQSLDIQIQQNVLTIGGKRAGGTPEKATAYRNERFAGEFRRVVTLPEDADAERVDARYRDGVLQITVQRRGATRPRQIEVH